MTGLSNIEGLAKLDRPHATSQAIARILGKRRTLGKVDLDAMSHLSYLDGLLRDLEALLATPDTIDADTRRDALVEMGARVVAWLEENEKPLITDFARMRLPEAG